MIKLKIKNENTNRTTDFLLIIAFAIVSIFIGTLIGYCCGKHLTKGKRLLSMQRVQQIKLELKEAMRKKEELHKQIAKSENKENEVSSKHSYKRENKYVSSNTRNLEAENSPWTPLSRKLDEIDYDNKKKLEKINKKSWQQGYSLELRRKAAIQTLIDIGYSRQEATITVKEIEEQGCVHLTV